MLVSALPTTLLALLFTTALAAPLDPLRAGSQASVAWADLLDQPTAELIAYFPKITLPVASTVWREGDQISIAWNGTTPPYAPAQLVQTANITLGYLSETSPGYHLDINHPLATVELYKEPYSVKVILPTGLVSRSTYLLILGSSANSSPLFTIEGTGFEEDTPTSTSSATVRQIEARPTTYVIGGSTTVIGQAGSSAPGVTTSISVINAGASPSPSSPAASSAAASSTSARLASQETASASGSVATPRPTSAAGSLKASHLTSAFIGAVMAWSLLM